MSNQTLSRILQVAYPAAIFLAVLASAGIKLVQVSGADLSHLWLNPKNSHFNRTIVSAEVKACLQSDPPTCDDERDRWWLP